MWGVCTFLGVLAKDLSNFVLLVLDFQLIIREPEDTFALNTQSVILEIDDEDIAFEAVWMFLHIELHQDCAIRNEPRETRFSVLPPSAFQFFPIDRLRQCAGESDEKDRKQPVRHTFHAAQNSI